VRAGFALGLALLAGCGPAPRPAGTAKIDATREAWYGDTLQRLTAMNREAESLYRGGKADRASDLILRAEPLANRLVAVSRPTLGAVEAASDLDDLYGRMLLANRNYGWARLEFQKNLARWKNWTPQTPETARRLKQANDAIAECDRRMAE